MSEKELEQNPGTGEDLYEENIMGDGFSDEEDWDDSYEDEGYEEGDEDEGSFVSPSPKAAGLFSTNNLIVGGVVLVGLAVGAFQFLGGGGQQPAPPQPAPVTTETTAAVQEENPQPVPVAPAVPVAEAQPASSSPPPPPEVTASIDDTLNVVDDEDFVGFFNDSSLLDQRIEQRERERAQEEALKTASEETEVQKEMPSEALPMPAPLEMAGDVNPPALTPFPEVGELDGSEDGTSGSLELLGDMDMASGATGDVLSGQPDTEAETGTHDPAGSEDVSVTPDLFEKLDMITERLAGLEARIDGMQHALESAGDNAPNSVEDVQAMRESLERLEGKIGTLEKRGTKTSASSRRVSSSAAPKVPKARPVTWVLRAAQKGQAIVSDKSGRDVRTVSVGDRLPGVGEIQGVVFENNRWTVRGTQGTITQ